MLYVKHIKYGSNVPFFVLVFLTSANIIYSYNILPTYTYPNNIYHSAAAVEPRGYYYYVRWLFFFLIIFWIIINIGSDECGNIKWKIII